MHIGVNIKEKILNDVKMAVKEFEQRPDIRTKFGEPIVGYADSRNVIFDMYFSRTICDHPKKIYRPGNTVCLLYTSDAADEL